MASYDEAEFKNRLSRLDRARKTAFAAACAERLWPIFPRCAEASGEGDVAALRTVLDDAWLTDDPREAAWAARQVYEAADYAALCAHPELRLHVPGTGRTLLESAMVQTALAEMAADLVAVESPPTDDWEGLRMRARDEGSVWAATLPSGDA